MSSIVLPAWVEANHRREQWVDRQLAAHAEIDARLKEIDSRLSLVFIHENARVPGLVPGRWHVKRDNSEAGAPNTYLPIVGENGEYVEPHSGIIANLQARDLWRYDVMRDVHERQAREEAEKERAKQAEREAQREELRLAVKAQTSPGVLFSDTAWTAKAGGRRE